MANAPAVHSWTQIQTYATQVTSNQLSDFMFIHIGNFYDSLFWKIISSKLGIGLPLK